MRRREFITLIAGAIAAWPLAARAQQKPVIGFLGAGAAESSTPLVEAFKHGLRENALVEDKDYRLEPRWAEGRYERFPIFSRELVDGGARVIVVGTIAAARVAQRATSAIPIVMASMNDPVGNGIVASLARPGGNTTGMATLNQDVSPKLVEFLHGLLPRATVFAVLFNPANPSNPAYLESARAQAAPRGIALQPFALNAPGELNDVFLAITARKPDALLVLPDAATLDRGTRIAALGLEHRLPLISTDADLTAAGGLISYGISRRDNYRRSAYFVRKVLDGVKPADLPVEQPTRILLSVNLKTARELGLSVPDAILVRADEVIE
jgi:putative ABC transport system substrate-binding protein